MTDTTVKLSDAAIRRRQLKEFWFYFSQNRGAVIGLGVFVLLVLTAIFAPLIAPHDPTQQYRDALLVPPIWQDGGRAGFLLGTDAVGRDMLSRLIYGAQYSLFIGIVVVAIALTGGIFIGLLAGFYGGWVDTVIMRVMDVILAFPSLLLALVPLAFRATGGPLARVLAAAALQGAIGYAQYLTGLPLGLVLAHMVGTTLYTVAVAQAAFGKPVGARTDAGQEVLQRGRLDGGGTVIRGVGQSHRRVGQGQRGFQSGADAGTLQETTPKAPGG